MEANILPAASEIRGSIGPTHFIGSKMDRVTKAAQQREPTPVSGLQGWFLQLGFSVSLRRLRGSLPRHQQTIWILAQGNPAARRAVTGHQNGLEATRIRMTKSCREFQNRNKDPSWPRTYQGDQRGIRSEVVWKDSSSRAYKTWHGYQPPNQDRNPPKMEVFMKPCPFVDYIE